MKAIVTTATEFKSTKDANRPAPVASVIYDASTDEFWATRPTRVVKWLNKDEASLLAAAINENGGKAYVGYDRDATTRLTKDGKNDVSKGTYNARYHWSVSIKMVVA